MFRNPRENVGRQTLDHVSPSTGRPPTPPQLGGSYNTPTKSPFFGEDSDKIKNTVSSPAAPLPMLGRAPTGRTSSLKKNHAKPNQSILSFFGKTDKTQESPSKDTALFFDETGQSLSTPTLKQTRSGEQDVYPLAEEEAECMRYNETATPVKRRKTDAHDESDFMICTPPPERTASMDEVGKHTISEKGRRPVKQRGGFVDDSSDDEDCTLEVSESEEKILPDRDNQTDIGREDDQSVTEAGAIAETSETATIPLKPPDEPDFRNDPAIPSLARESTSMFAPDDFGDQDFDDEFFPEGEEYLERQYMEEQLAMERAFEDDSKSESGTDGPRTPRFEPASEETEETEEAIASCPMCNGSMKGLSESEASAHVNACLDGTAQPLPKSNVVQKEEKSTALSSGGPKRFQRAAIPRPAQANPFSRDKEDSKKSAFSRLMSGHAEDAAWAEAASNEAHSRGKPAYQRTCPFYKIMPGLYICVDAFRYGKVEGQNAYFLSHFHSDHYIGLTSSWSHGPIYASKVTCNLMLQQLKVDPKWIFPLEFEKKVEVPDTNGVFVTMIPANHCPGSSLYLFEKTIGKNKDGSPKLNRILHCGDFRACPAHVHHPSLKPNILDAVSGKLTEQSIDTCYLDTTYLTPKYSFPSQHDVIDACAQMCVSLSKEIVDSSDGWEKVKLERAGSTMKKFLEQGAAETSPIKQELEEDEVKPKARGKLLVIIGTYSIGKERICLGIARALGSKIYAPPSKMRICRALEDAELNALLTSNPLEAQVHMQMLMEIRAETLHDYLVGFKPHFSRIVGFRPTGWSYRPPTSRFTENPSISTVLNSDGWKSRFTMRDLVPQRGSTRESNCFGVPYSEHSSFRELTMFCCALRIKRVVPTVNVGSARSREKMKGWIEKWDAEKRKNGLFQVEVGPQGWGSGDGALRYGV